MQSYGVFYTYGRFARFLINFGSKHRKSFWCTSGMLAQPNTNLNSYSNLIYVWSFLIEPPTSNKALSSTNANDNTSISNCSKFRKSRGILRRCTSKPGSYLFTKRRSACMVWLIRTFTKFQPTNPESQRQDPRRLNFNQPIGFKSRMLLFGPSDVYR